MVQAIADNNQLALVKFSSCGVTFRARDLLDLLQSKASSLRHLTLQGMDCKFYALPPSSPEEVATFASAVRALTGLQSLTLEQFSSNPELSALTLSRLQHHTTLRKLSILGCSGRYVISATDRAHDDAIVNAVSVMLQSRVPLEVLELKNMSLSQTGTANLVQGLDVCSSLAELTLEGDMVREAKQELLRFFQANRSTTEHALRHLSLNDTTGSGLRHSFQSILTAAATASIGASLHALCLPERIRDIQELLLVLVAGEHHLSSMSLGSVSALCWSQLTRCLPNMLHLQELRVKQLFERDASSTDFVRAMRQNGSLYRVSETTVQTTAFAASMPLFNAVELQQIQVYCQRNLVTRELLQNQPVSSCEACNGHGETLLSLLPRLFHVMKPAWRMAPNSIFVGLLACGDDTRLPPLIGPRADNFMPVKSIVESVSPSNWRQQLIRFFVYKWISYG
jgi:hypothetical protein